jgi:hypothetical protein
MATNSDLPGFQVSPAAKEFLKKLTADSKPTPQAIAARIRENNGAFERLAKEAPESANIIDRYVEHTQTQMQSPDSPYSRRLSEARKASANFDILKDAIAALSPGIRAEVIRHIKHQTSFGVGKTDTGESPPQISDPAHREFQKCIDLMWDEAELKTPEGRARNSTT